MSFRLGVEHSLADVEVSPIGVERSPVDVVQSPLGVDLSPVVFERSPTVVEWPPVDAVWILEVLTVLLMWSDHSLLLLSGCQVV